MNSNWKAGYGFNNPNPERIRQGLEPLNFDGSTDEEEDGFLETMIGNFVGDVITYGFKSTFVASKNLWQRVSNR